MKTSPNILDTEAGSKQDTTEVKRYLIPREESVERLERCID